MHKSITKNRVMRMVMRNETKCENKGICVYCGKTCDGVEPDACSVLCPKCGRPGVNGAEELLIWCA